MHWILVGLLTALTVAAQTPEQTALTLNAEGNRVAESGNYPRPNGFTARRSRSGARWDQPTKPIPRALCLTWQWR